jgi:hypothetical protein
MTNSVSGFSGADISDSSQGTVVATFTFTNVPAGAQSENVVVTFQSPGPAYTLSNGFTIH